MNGHCHNILQAVEKGLVKKILSYYLLVFLVLWEVTLYNQFQNIVRKIKIYNINKVYKDNSCIIKVLDWYAITISKK